MPIELMPTGQACGAIVRGVDLREHLDGAVVAELRAAWLEHHVLVFPDQPIDDDDLERISCYFGELGGDPFFGPIPGRDHVVAISRHADEKSPIFAEGWHSDWSFEKSPPIGTCLRSVVVPPQGGDTLFANQHAALDAMPRALRERIQDKRAVHSARDVFSRGGLYGDADKANRSMDIRPSTWSSRIRRSHPIILEHPESGRPGLFGARGYVVGVEGLGHTDSQTLLDELSAWQTRPEFQYRHRWEQDMIVLWDNRSVLHASTGGYEGFERKLHRTTIRAWGWKSRRWLPGRGRSARRGPA